MTATAQEIVQLAAARNGVSLQAVSDTADAGPAGWAPVDLGPFVDGSYRPPAPALLQRTDGVRLVYPGRVHWLSGEPEALKSWAALITCAQVLDQGGRAVYVDLEDGPGGIVMRLLALGVSPDVICNRFGYLSPQGPLSHARRAALEQVVSGAAVLVVDACTEALAQQGLSSKDDVDIATWLELLPRWAARLGPAVLVLDHVVKDAESRGRWATGSQHKLAGLDGVAFTLESVHRGGVGLTGRSRLWVEKDRHGQVRGTATVCSTGGRDWAGDLVVDSTGPVLDAYLEPPAVQVGPFRPTVMMQRVSEALAGAAGPLSTRDVEDRVPGKAATVRQALALLVDEGHVAIDPGHHNSKQHRLLSPYPPTGPAS